MKARYPTLCECCKAPVCTGEQVVIFHGRPWIPGHLLAYKARRRTLAGAAGK